MESVFVIFQEKINNSENKDLLVQQERRDTQQQLTQATYEELLQIDNLLEFQSDKQGVGLYPDVENSNLFLLTSTGLKNNATQDLAVPCIKLSHVRTLHDLVTHQVQEKVKKVEELQQI